ncbi:MSMEG_0567/sll0787 family protein [Nocardioides sp.]|uniref:MSMEG_0567/sll0787 family protein n=1 Tax=Nocardioides sp. TaxID=35761 RepID=UPI003516E233
MMLPDPGGPLVSDVVLAGGRPGPTRVPGFTVRRADPADGAGEGSDLAAYRRLRRAVFVSEQGLFTGSDHDDVDDDPRTIVLVARTPDGEVLGGVRVAPSHHPAMPTSSRDLGWWTGSRLVVAPGSRLLLGVGAALVRAACAEVESRGALRFDALVQAPNEGLFRRLGWTSRALVHAHGRPHVEMTWPIDRAARLAHDTKSALGELLLGVSTGAPAGFVGDDGAPVPGSDLIAACDAILPSMVERDPTWAGWCAVLVNLNDLHAMGARPVGILDAVAARDASFARRILAGLAEAAAAYGVPVLGGHTQLGVPAALSVTALGRTSTPVPGGGARPGETLRLTADLGGDWRPGYTGTQWDSTTRRRSPELRALAAVVPTLAPTAAKDVSMAGIIGTVGMLAEASGVRAELDVAAVPTPSAASAGDWLTCFPGFAIVSTETAAGAGTALPGFLTSAACGRTTAGHGVGLRWPDDVVTEAVDTVTGLGAA